MLNKIFASVCVLTSIVAFTWFTKSAKAGRGVTSGLIAHWSFDAATIKGKTAEDVWGDSNGEIKGEPKVVKGKVKEALSFDRVDDWVLVDSKSINIDYQQITMGCWILPEKVGGPHWNRIMSLDEAHGQNEASLMSSTKDGTHGFFLRIGAKNADERRALVQVAIPTGGWIHIVGVYDGKESKYYENGELKTTYAFPEGKISGGKLRLGIASGTDPEKFDEHVGAIMDELFVYNRALSEAEVKQNFAATEGPSAVDASFKLAEIWGRIKANK